MSSFPPMFCLPVVRKNPIHHYTVPAAPRARRNAFLIQPCRDLVIAQSFGSQSLHARDYLWFASVEPVRLTALTAALLCPFTHPCAPQLRHDLGLVVLRYSAH